MLGVGLAVAAVLALGIWIWVRRASSKKTRAVVRRGVEASTETQVAAEQLTGDLEQRPADRAASDVREIEVARDVVEEELADPSAPSDPIGGDRPRSSFADELGLGK